VISRTGERVERVVEGEEALVVARREFDVEDPVAVPRVARSTPIVKSLN